jgi:hypothetical protein
MNAPQTMTTEDFVAQAGNAPLLMLSVGEDQQVRVLSANVKNLYYLLGMLEQAKEVTKKQLADRDAFARMNAMQQAVADQELAQRLRGNGIIKGH